MQEPPSSPQDSRRPRFKTRAPQPEANVFEESRAHEPPEVDNRLSMPSNQPSPAEVRVEKTPVSAEPQRDVLQIESPVAQAAKKDDVPPIPPLEMPSWVRPAPAPRRTHGVLWIVLGGTVISAAAFVAGYAVHDFFPPEAMTMQGAVAGPVRALKVDRLNPESQAALDGAFSMMKGDKPQEARALFEELLKKHPGWPRLALEQARAAFYQHDGIGAKGILDMAEKAGQIGPADALFMEGLLQMSASNFANASQTFDQATSCDPTREDFYYFWGESLRRQGKPAEAAARLRSALLRNQHEAMDGFYRMKMWLSEIQAGIDVSSGSAAEVDAQLASPYPSGYALAAAAARALRAENFPSTADALRRASRTLDPLVFQLLLQDSLFTLASFRPELAEFYGHGAPAAGH